MLKSKILWLGWFGLLLGMIQIALAQQPDSEQLQREGKQFVQLLQAGQFDSAEVRMTAVMKTAMPVKNLQQAWSDLNQRVGKFQEIESVTVDKLDSLFQVNVNCRFEGMPLNIQVIFNQQLQVAGMWFRPVSAPEYEMPDYVKKDSFHEEEIKFGLPDWQLPGILSIPNGDGPFAAVVLVHGSGPNDRDETIGPNRPFRDLAWGLASQGILVLRYDKRTKVYATKIKPQQVTVEDEVIVDALAAIQFLQGRAEVNHGKIFLLGHSLGAMLAPEIGTRAPGLAGLIMLAAPTRCLEDVMYSQISYLKSLDTTGSKESAAQMDSLLSKIRQLQAGKLPPTTMLLSGPASYFYDLRQRNQLNFIRQLTLPILILQGERDYQVTMEDFTVWQKLAAEQKTIQTILYPDLNHLFIAGQGKSTPQEYMGKQGHVAGEVIRDIHTWIADPSR